MQQALEVSTDLDMGKVGRRTGRSEGNVPADKPDLEHEVAQCFVTMPCVLYRATVEGGKQCLLPNGHDFPGPVRARDTQMILGGSTSAGHLIRLTLPSLIAALCPDAGDDMESLVPGQFIDELGSELGSAFTVQTVTQTEVELPLSRNATEEEARGSIATLEPIELTPSATGLYEGFTAPPELFTTAVTPETAATEEESVTREDVTAVWTVPEEATTVDLGTAITTIDLGTAITTVDLGTASTTETAEVSSVEEVTGVTATPGLESALPFTVEDELVQVTAAPGAGHLPEQPISPTGKSPGLQ